MTPPISIDGTDITGATIDGQDVQEITVDGDTVFSAGPNLPVAYSNLVAWYPFDSATYGGSNADDVTAIIGGSGDDTAYNGTVNGPIYQSSGGVTDISAGANSGAFGFNGVGNEFIRLNGLNQFDGSAGNDFTMVAWIKTDSLNDNAIFEVDDQWGLRIDDGNGDRLHLFTFGGNTGDTFSVIPTGIYTHVALYWDPGSIAKAYINGQFDASDGNTDTSSGTRDISIGPRLRPPDSLDGPIDDVRFYNRELTSTEINQIYQNTQP